jgi:hypothetical protein
MVYKVNSVDNMADKQKKFISEIQPTLEYLSNNAKYEEYSQRVKLAEEIWQQVTEKIEQWDDVEQISKTIQDTIIGKGINLLYSQQQLSPYDIFQLLIEMFQIPDSVQLETHKEFYDAFSDDKITTEPELKHLPFTYLINAQDIRGETQLNELINREESVFDPENYFACETSSGVCNKRVIVRNIKQLPELFVINVQKAGSITDRVITYPSTELISNNNRLQLSGIIVQMGEQSRGHYYAYVKCNDGWYKFNDISPGKKLIHITKGDINSLSDYTTICQNATNFIYM